MQYSPDAYEAFAQTERLGHVVIGTEFQADHTIDLIATMPGYSDDRRVGTRSDLTQQNETILLTELKVGDDHTFGSARGELSDDLLLLRSSNDPPVLPCKIAYDQCELY